MLEPDDDDDDEVADEERPVAEVARDWFMSTGPIPAATEHAAVPSTSYH